MDNSRGHGLDNPEETMDATVSASRSWTIKIWVQSSDRSRQARDTWDRIIGCHSGNELIYLEDFNWDLGGVVKM